MFLRDCWLRYRSRNTCTNFLEIKMVSLALALKQRVVSVSRQNYLSFFRGALLLETRETWCTCKWLQANSSSLRQSVVFPSVYAYSEHNKTNSLLSKGSMGFFHSLWSRSLLFAVMFQLTPMFPSLFEDRWLCLKLVSMRSDGQSKGVLPSHLWTISDNRDAPDDKTQGGDRY